VVLSKELRAKNLDLLQIDFPMPWVVKPATEGSSIGVSIAKDEEQVMPAVEKAFSLSDRVIIEKYIEGKEVHIGMLNDRLLGGVEVRPSLEFYSYEAKYQAGLTEYILPPELDSMTYERARETALSAHIALGCRGATRVDLMIDEKGNPKVLEVNTIPGMTETSLLPKIARLAGLDFPALIEEILRSAFDESKEKEK
jgi:D-alanine-D-alanine ligase